MARKYVCAAPGCGNLPWAKYCEDHTPGLQNKKFLLAAAETETDLCIEWPYTRDALGYGVFYSQSKAHRVACEYYHGAQPFKGAYVRHLCGNPPCINKRHLVWGTPKENADDKKLHGTLQVGEARPTSKLSNADVLAIFMGDRSRTLAEVAAEYGIRQQTVSDIRAGNRAILQGLPKPKQRRSPVRRGKRASKLTVADVQRIRAAPITKRSSDLARELGVSNSCVCRARYGERWKHVV